MYVTTSILIKHLYFPKGIFTKALKCHFQVNIHLKFQVNQIVASFYYSLEYLHKYSLENGPSELSYI